jgi:signal transduction histidine kinase
VLYGLFGLTVLTWGVRTLTYVIESLPVAQWVLWRAIFLCATGGFVVLLTVFTLRFAGLRIRWFERLLLLYWLIAPLSMLVTLGAADGWLDRVWRNGLAPLTLVMLAATWIAVRRQRSGAAWAMLAGTALASAGGLHDTLLFSGTLAKLLPDWAGHRIFLMHHGANVLLLVMGGIFTQRFVQSLSEVEALNRTLESRVAQREAEIARSYARLSALERQSAAVEERGRIMQDMHDGLGVLRSRRWRPRRTTSSKRSGISASAGSRSCGRPDCARIGRSTPTRRRCGSRRTRHCSCCASCRRPWPTS